MQNNDFYTLMANVGLQARKVTPPPSETNFAPLPAVLKKKKEHAVDEGHAILGAIGQYGPDSRGFSRATPIQEHYKTPKAALMFLFRLDVLYLSISFICTHITLWTWVTQP
ncbi:hypothetical protein AOLI_G00244090 [Acnodon oligacanthus]